MHQPNDRGSKRLIEEFGASILRLAGVTGFTSWRAVANELVAPRRTPDGLIEADFPGREESTLFVVEIESDEARTNARQVYEDIQMAYLTRGVVPEVIFVVLRPKGRVVSAGEFAIESPSGAVRATASWPVVRPYLMDAEDLFAANDVGLIPWATLAQTTQPPDDFIRRCRDTIVANTPDDRARKDLLALTQILAGNIYNEVLLDRILGGAEAMLTSPALDRAYKLVEERGIAKGKAEGKAEAAAEILRENILELLTVRCGGAPAELSAELAGVTDVARLKQLNRVAMTCADLPAFLADLRSPG